MAHKAKQRCAAILEMLTLHSPARLTVWTAMPTPALLPHPQPRSSHLPKLPSPPLPEVRCLRAQWLASPATLHLCQLSQEPTLPHLPPAPHLLPSQPAPPTLQRARCRPPRPPRPRWSTMLAAISWLPFAWVRICLVVLLGGGAQRDR